MEILAWISPFIPESRTYQTILIGATVGLVVYFLTRKRYKLPPGPRGLPLVGSLLSFRNVTIYEKLMEWEKTYGPVMTVNIGPVRFIMLNRLDVIQEALVRKSADFAGRPCLPSVRLISEGFKDIVLTDYGPRWQLHRRLALKALAYYMKGDRFEETINDVLDMSLNEMRKETAAFDIQLYTELIIFNIISKICFNEKFAPDNETFRNICQATRDINSEFGNGFVEDTIPLLEYFPTTKFKRAQQRFSEILAFIYSRVNQHRATFSSDVQRDFTDAMLLAQLEAQEEENPELLAEITDTHIAQTVSDIFQGGFDTSRQTLYWTILYIAAFPDIQAKIHKELDTVMGDRRYPVMSDRTKLHYMEAVLYESMRLATITPLSLPHTTTCDTTIGEYEIPKGTAVMVNLHAVHHDPRYWEEPEKFKPERFLDASGKMAHKPEAWMPFSVGKRACLAEALAKPELHLLLAGIYRNFEIQMPEGVTADITPEKGGIVYLPKPYKIVIQDRFK